MGGLFSLLGMLGFGVAGLKNAYDSCSVYDNSRQRAIEDGRDVFYGRRGEMYDVVTGKPCRKKKLDDGRVVLVELKNDRFIRDISYEKEKTQRELAYEKGHIGYIIDLPGVVDCPRALCETSTGRIYKHNPKMNTISYYRVENRRLVYEDGRSIPPGSALYYKSPESPAPDYLMKEIIKYEEKAGIYREQREKKED